VAQRLVDGGGDGNGGGSSGSQSSSSAAVVEAEGVLWRCAAGKGNLTVRCNPELLATMRRTPTGRWFAAENAGW